MVGWTARGLGIDAAETEPTEIQFIDKDIDHPHRIVLANPVLKVFREKRRLTPIYPLNKTLHPGPPKTPKGIVTRTAFSHSLGQNRRFQALSISFRLLGYS